MRVAVGREPDLEADAVTEVAATGPASGPVPGHHAASGRLRAALRVGLRLPRHHAAVRRLRVPFVVAALGLGGYALATRWTTVGGDLRHVGISRTLVSLPLLVAALYCGMRSWRAVLAGLGSPLPVLAAARIYFVGQLGKYLPGSLWPVVAQMELGRDHDVPQRRSVGALGIAVVVSMATGLTLAGITLPLVDGYRHAGLWWLLVAIPAAAVLLVPRVLWRLLRLLPMPVLRRNLPGVMPTRAMVAAGVWITVGWLCYGGQVAILAAAFPGRSRATLLVAAAGGYALAWTIGLLAVVLPAGAGAREAVLVLALSPLLGTSPAIAVAVLTRALSTCGDLGLAAIASVGIRGSLAGSRAAARSNIDAPSKVDA